MGGGLMQLVAYGAQDIYLTGNPQITFFKVVYRRHTNFSMESIEQTWNGSGDSAAGGGSVSATISRNGDLVSRMYIQYIPNKFKLKAASDNTTKGTDICSNIGHSLLKEIECEIGGQRIDRHYGKWLTIWNELTEINPLNEKGFALTIPQTVNGAATGPMANEDVLEDTSGNIVTAFPRPFNSTDRANFHGREPRSTDNDADSDDLNHTQPTRNDLMSYNHKGFAIHKDVSNAAEEFIVAAPTIATVPLQFWFCRNPGLALPLIALQYHEVKINLKIEESSKLIQGGATAAAAEMDISNAGITLWVDYIYLDTDERRRFAQVSHEYLIEQLQLDSSKDFSSVNNHTLNFNHPVKELIFAGVPGQCINVGDGGVSAGGSDKGPATPLSITSGASDTTKLSIKLNGHERFAERKLRYFTRTQVYQHHTGHGGVTIRDSIGVYSFALKPEEHQPSGTCNFSRIDNAELSTTGNITNKLDVYAVNYNVLRIMSGMGGLAYSN